MWVITLRRENARMTARLEEQLSNRDQISQSLAETRRQLEEAMRRAEEQQKEIAEMRRSLDDLSQPQVNVPFADLELQDVRGGAGHGVSTVTSAPGRANLFLLFLHVRRRADFLRLRAGDFGRARPARLACAGIAPEPGGHVHK